MNYGVSKIKTLANERAERGTAAVELAIVLPILVMLVFGMVEATRMYQAWESLTYASREKARSVALGSTVSPIVIVQADVPGLNLTQPVTVTRTPASGACVIGTPVKVSLAHELSYSIPLLPPGSVTIRGETTMRCGG
jgi:Flp pilus assembly protein TadG